MTATVWVLIIWFQSTGPLTVSHIATEEACTELGAQILAGQHPGAYWTCHAYTGRVSKS
jgi:hypothetical protein